MKSVLFLLELLLLGLVMEAGKSYKSEYNETTNSRAPSGRLLAFKSLFSGVFKQVGPSMNVTQAIDDQLTIVLRPFDVPLLRPASTFLFIGIINSTVVTERVLTITEIDDVIVTTVFFNSKSATLPNPRNLSQGLIDEDAFTDLTLDDLTKRCDCTSVFVQQGPDEFIGNYQPCPRVPRTIPDLQSVLNCTTFLNIGRRVYQRLSAPPSFCDLGRGIKH